MNTVPIKFLKPQNDVRKKHIAHFTFHHGTFHMAGVKQADETAEVFPENMVLHISQDDKEKVLLGLTISKKVTAILMHLDYKVRLPDPDFPIGPQHKLILSVMEGCLKKDGKKVGYSGPTLVSISSKKHDSSCAESHVEEFDIFVSCEQFREAAKTLDGQVKLLVFMSVDGGLNEAPKNQQTMAVGMHHFTAYDSDALP